LCGCSRATDPHQPEGNSEQMLHEELELDPLEALPTPAADGPKLAPIALAVPVMAKPKQDAEKIGYLRVGARVARSEEPVSTENCPAGWYKVRPLGYVCADTDSTTDEAQDRKSVV